MALLLAGAINSIWWSSGGDAITYLGVARSLWQDGQLALLGQREIFNQIGITFFYAPAFAFGDRPFLVLSIMQWFVAVGAMVGCYHWLRKILSRDDSILLTGLMFLNNVFLALLSSFSHGNVLLLSTVWDGIGVPTSGKSGQRAEVEKGLALGARVFTVSNLDGINTACEFYAGVGDGSGTVSISMADAQSKNMGPLPAAYGFGECCGRLHGGGVVVVSKILGQPRLEC
ncbi:MAG: hypothetical protein JKX85_11030 [Phycisphaeraceae bacterium]|nr:hypothetical protein [Phycisphaeraceae bacterium]